MPQERTDGTLLRLAVPLIVSFWMRAGVTLVDTVYAAFLGDSAVAAVGLTVPVEFLMIAAWVGLSTGLTSVLSRAMGSGAHTQVEQYRRIGWRLVAVQTPLFALVGAALWFFAPHMTLAAETTRNFQIYGTVLIVGSALTTFWSVLPDSLVKAHHDTRSTMWAGILTNLINVSLNTLFLFVFGWGIFGIAFSTVLGRLGGLAYALARARRHETRRRAAATGDPGRPDPAPYRAILGLAIPSSLTFVLMATENGLVNALLATMDHATEALAAYSIYYRVILFALQPVIAISVAMLPFVARLHGVGDAAGIRRALRDAATATTLYCILLLAPAMVFLAPALARRLAESELTMRYATFALWTVPVACLLGAPFLYCRPVFEAMQRGKPGLLMAAVRYLLLTGPLAWLGMSTAQRLGQPPLYGVVVGLLFAGGAASAGLYVWLRASLGRLAAAR